MFHKIIGVFKDVIFRRLLIMTFFMSVLTCMGWGVPLGLLPNVILPVTFSFLATATIHYVSSSFGMIYWGGSSTRTVDEAQEEFDLKHSLEKARRHAMKGEFEEAAKLFERALAIDPTDLHATEDLAKALSD